MGTDRDAPPITGLLGSIRASLEKHPRLVLEAPPGAGKTTMVPPALLDAPWLAGRRIVMLEPRRLAARAAATFMAAQRGEPVGQTVGYRIRFENKASAATRIEVITEGIFTRMIQADPTLEGIGAVLFDEFHERHLAGDLGLALARDVQSSLRPDLRLVLMSATLDGEQLATWLDAPRLASEGRSFPVDIDYPPARRNEVPLTQLARILPSLLAESAGDVLVFLPGQREINRALRMLQQRIDDPDVCLLPLHGSLPLSQQRAALQPAAPGTRHVILATNVAESSVTLPGIRSVIDLGQAREPRFEPASGLTRLRTVAISQASADQRAGRAGRVAPGRCLRLWPESRRLEPMRHAEIEQADLAPLALELAAWGSDALDWLTPPPTAALAQGRDLLQQLGALDERQRITPLGKAMLATGAPPRLAAAICAAENHQLGLMADLLALLESRSPLRAAGQRDDDLRQRLAALHAFRDGGRQASRRLGSDTGTLAQLEKVSQGWRRRLGSRERPSGTPDALHAGRLLLPAWPDRVARAEDGNPLRYKLANGRGVRLSEDSALVGEPWLLAVDVQPGRGDALIRTALPFPSDALETVFPQAFHQRRRQAWHAERQRGEAYVEHCFGELVLQRETVPLAADEQQGVLLNALRQQGLDALPWNRASTTLRQRIECLRSARPDLGLPDCSDDALLASLEDWLALWLAGKTSLKQLQAGDLCAALDARLDHGMRQQLDALAPERLEVPSGNRHRIDYSDPSAPVLAVKLQELFGLRRTPAIAGGRLPLTLHLLSPAGRPMQVTRDLASFWDHTYADVRKDLRGRYPKHPWPEDPANAKPTARTKRRKS